MWSSPARTLLVMVTLALVACVTAESTRYDYYLADGYTEAPGVEH